MKLARKKNENYEKKNRKKNETWTTTVSAANVEIETRIHQCRLTCISLSTVIRIGRIWGRKLWVKRKDTWCGFDDSTTFDEWSSKQIFDIPDWWTKRGNKKSSTIRYYWFDYIRPICVVEPFNWLSPNWENRVRYSQTHPNRHEKSINYWFQRLSLSLFISLLHTTYTFSRSNSHRSISYLGIFCEFKM